MRWLLRRTCPKCLGRSSETQLVSSSAGQVALRQRRPYPNVPACLFSSAFCSSSLSSFLPLKSCRTVILPSPPLCTAFGSRCEVADSVQPHRLLHRALSHRRCDSASVDGFRGFAATVGYGASMSLFHRVEIGIGGTLAVWSAQRGSCHSEWSCTPECKGILFCLSPVPDSEFTFDYSFSSSLEFAYFDGPNDLEQRLPLTALRAVADKPFWRMGITASLGVPPHARTNR